MKKNSKLPNYLIYSVFVDDILKYECKIMLFKCELNI